MSDNKPVYKILIIPGTHWDREWRFDFEETRQRLVEMIDHTMDLLEKYPQIPAFVLDGQFMPIKDYLEVRPHNRARLEKLIREGRIQIGPWFSLPDFFVILGESTIRNLLHGIENCRQFGAVMMEGMTNSSWGQISQMPQILKGFGIATYASYHGVPGHLFPIEFIWQAPDGSEVLFIRSPETTRATFFLSTRFALAPTPEEADCIKPGSSLLENAYRLTDKPMMDDTPFYGDDRFRKVKYDTLYRYFSEYVSRIRPETTTGNILVGDICDAQQMCPDILNIVEELRKRHPKNETIELSSIPRYFADVRSKAKNLKVFRGEMRFPHKRHFAFRLCNILATRLYLKQQNRKTEYLLTKWTEPFAAINWLLNDVPYPSQELNQAWEMMFINHSHDAIGGCSIDTVHDEMMTRYRQIDNRCTALLHRSLGKISLAKAKGKLRPYESRLVVFNPLPFEATQVIEAYIDIPDACFNDVVSVSDDAGNSVPCSILSCSMPKSVSVELPLIGCPALPIRRAKIELLCENLPSIGYRQFFINTEKRDSDRLPPSPACERTMENRFLKVNFNPDGTIDLIDKQTTQQFSGLHYFEDGGLDRSARNSWYINPPQNNEVFSSKGIPAKIRLIQNTPLSTKIQVDYTLTIPQSIDTSNVKIGRQEHFATYRYESRSTHTIDLHIVSIFTLHCDSKRLDVETRFTNTAMDHRLQVLFPSDVKSDSIWADAPFDVVERPVKKLDPREYDELTRLGNVQTYPLTSFVDIASPERSLGLIVDGLPEYDIMQDSRNTLALTLLRSILHGRIDPETQSPPLRGSQCLGDHCFRYSIYPHSGNWQQSGLYREAQIHNLQPKAVQTMLLVENWKSGHSFISFNDDGLDISAVKKAHTGNGLIVRVFNPTDREINTGMNLDIAPIKNVWIVNLLEEKQSKADFTMQEIGTIRICVPPKKIMTFLVEFH
jgi:mannosylglycerate hydrolase